LPALSKASSRPDKFLEVAKLAAERGKPSHELLPIDISRKCVLQANRHNERRFSVPWMPPAPRMREYVQVLRAIWHCWKTGERPSYEGQHYRFTLMTPNFAPEPIDAPPPPVMIAAVGPAMLKWRPRNATASSSTASAPADISTRQ
jgi:alkanesulfonate monooxygenase SsuD/methylene tetrahydromethanopterin reductase-like flavin-dependent oxidoreductase (luciferase family)